MEVAGAVEAGADEARERRRGALQVAVEPCERVVEGDGGAVPAAGARGKLGEVQMGGRAQRDLHAVDAGPADPPKVLILVARAHRIGWRGEGLRPARAVLELAEGLRNAYRDLLAQVVGHQEERRRPDPEPLRHRRRLRPVPRHDG